MSLDVGVIHFVGIGGIGMSGMAEILCNLGYTVTGSDMSESANVERLRKHGIEVFIGHEAKNVTHAAVVVKSTAVQWDNPELLEARELRIPVVRRSEMLAELMRLKMTVAVAGTHGKTTTTSLLAALFEAARLDPTVINGGIINAYGTNTRLGQGSWMVVEADESDGTFTKIPLTIAVITNIDPEHLDYYGSFDALKDAFRQFIDNLPFYGFAVVCTDHPEVVALSAKVIDRRIISYGTNPQADVRAINIRNALDGQHFDVAISDRVGGTARTIKGFVLPMHGVHNLCNALASVAVGNELSMNDDVLKKALENFEGVKRRFTVTGTGMGMTVVDDYGHHPVEIAATLKAARSVQDTQGAKVIAVVQPHRYTRLRDLFDQFTTCFSDADVVLVTDVYPAGEKPIEGIDKEHLVMGLKQGGHRHVAVVDSMETLPQQLAELGAEGDMVVCMGAGSITYTANQLPQLLTQHEKKNGTQG
ncbi:MAG: UDP-N-acetylmuramate--L-alanine ligase [Alphaproteobacteria bacterium]|nr:UDP-N-acetylmuramate--L-alanine ligase [Alphaproteobacteria bacterium]